ncbi:lipocalin family protein [Flavobacteriaceae bacterium]|nr:lipocalin family protein [Flavobacteriaceae bacterium]MDB2413436.1 lipocalin family protein [Flavobacteriaceae bacterium]
MKKFISLKSIVLLLLFMILIGSCGDNDDSDALSIEGRWNLSSISINSFSEQLNSCDLETYIDLRGDGSGSEYLYYTDSPNNPNIEPCGLDLISDVSYSTNPNLSNTFSFTITYGANDDFITGNAIINENTLVFTGSYPFEQDEVYEIIYIRE